MGRLIELVNDVQGAFMYSPVILSNISVAFNMCVCKELIYITDTVLVFFNKSIDGYVNGWDLYNHVSGSMYHAMY